MNMGVLAQNVRRLRIARRMSQSDLAEASGVSLPAIKGLENSKAKPRMNTLLAIAKALGANLQELFLPVRELRVVRFRSSRRMQNRENILAKASRWLDDFDYLEKALKDEQPFGLGQIRQKCSRNHTVEAAALCREKLGLKTDEPIRNICGLLESAGIKIYPIEMASDGFFGLSIGEEDGGPAIVVNVWERITVERRIFSAAHELGHLMLHLEAFDVRKTTEDKEEERESDLFAGHFLMPDAGFLKEWNSTAGLHWIKRVLKVKRIYSVSYKTVLYRLIEHGAVDEKNVWKDFLSAYQRLFKRSLSFRDEPDRLKTLDFVEDRYTRLARKAIEKETVSTSRGAELLGISLGEMRDLMQNWGAVL
ncbi:MAG: ImmA/IrrE family metallo-endopeptidase [Syntrophorhabdus sp.]|nr:ImmA/IrrE family metallo-endopeptidase [Syntrophorhabdus sp.]